MPISEDEFDYRQEAQSTMSKAELRKTHKPIMEKRRRARINHCLNEIKTLILEAMKKDPARHSKLEKADILEMAVKHLQNVQRQQLAVAISTDPSVLRKFKNGFDQCATEINRFVSQIEGVDTALRQRINQHLTKCIKGIEQIGHVNVNFPSFANLNLFGGSGFFRSEAGESSGSSGDQNNNPRIQLPQGLQLIPSRLPTGEFALLVPNSSSLPFLPHLGESRPSAFVSVVPSSCNKCPSPVQSPQTSPKGFKPVGHKSAFTPTFKQEPLQHQVPQVTSTSLEKNPELLEVKTLKYPIHTYSNAEKERQAVNSPKQEALVTITNQSERHKQAQMKPDSVNFEENQSLPGSSKRPHPELNFEVPIVPIPKRPKIVVGPSFQVPLLKIVEPLRAKEDFCGTGKTEKQEKGDGSGSSNGGSSGEQNDMWRPW